MHGGIWILFGTNDYHDKKMCSEQEPCHYMLVKGQGQSRHLNFVHRLQWNLFVSDQ